MHVISDLHYVFMHTCWITKAVLDVVIVVCSVDNDPSQFE